MHCMMFEYHSCGGMVSAWCNIVPLVLYCIGKDGFIKTYLSNMYVQCTQLVCIKYIILLE